MWMIRIARHRTVTREGDGQVVANFLFRGGGEGTPKDALS
jgi:hypothetical protein